MAVDPNDKKAIVKGDRDATLNKEGTIARAAFLILSDRAREKLLAQYAEICGVKERTIVNMAREFTSFGKQAVAEF